MHHTRSLLLAPLALALVTGGAEAGERIGVKPAIALVEGRADASDFTVTPVVSRRRRDALLEAEAGASMLTMRGTWDCPNGYEQVFQGYIYAFQQKGVEVPQYGGVEPNCWFLPPMETTFLGSWERVAMCVVCARKPGAAIGTPPLNTTPIPGGGSAPVPDRNTQQPNEPAPPDTDTRTGTNPSRPGV